MSLTHRNKIGMKGTVNTSFAHVHGRTLSEECVLNCFSVLAQDRPKTAWP